MGEGREMTRMSIRLAAVGIGWLLQAGLTAQSKPDVRGIVVVTSASGSGESARLELLSRGAEPGGENSPERVEMPVDPSVLGVGKAWQQAYGFAYEQREGALIKKAGVQYAAPTVTIEFSEAEELSDRYCPPCEPSAIRRSNCNNPIAGALNDPEWSLNAESGANVLRAHQMFKTVKPGQGVVIGHPDTGYREHPEIFPGIDVDAGYDFLAGRDGPLDLLLSGLGRNPGHGTKTSSVIVSSLESKLTETRWVTGVSPAATLMPLRVGEGVVMLPGDVVQLRVNAARLADAIRAASGPNRQRVKKRAQVISISLGGLPGTRDLADAVAYAERNGVIVVAAAGNQVPGKKVVFPAAYPTAIAVAATNFDSRPWDCSSRGSKVLTSAPGESVWTAAAPAGMSCVQASTGTSFATATVAGIAALWLSFDGEGHQAELGRFRGDPSKNEENRIPRAFREVLAQAYRTPAGWDSRTLGPGIVDAAKALELPSKLLAPETFKRLMDRSVPSEAARVDWCPTNPGAFAGLRGILADAADPRARVEAVFGNDLCQVAVVADEVAMLQVTSTVVRDAFIPVSAAATPNLAHYAALRRALARQDISATLLALIR